LEDNIKRDLKKIEWIGIDIHKGFSEHVNPLNAELNPIRHLLALVGARHIVDVSRIRVNEPLGSYNSLNLLIS
jgi:hypothetical protein